jgi:hypothetical protein
MQAKPIRASKDNVLGVETQYLLWVQPIEGPTSPIVVYALDLPAGFPSLADPNSVGGYTRLREDVEITGYFFKRWAYGARDGVNTAPLVLAKTPLWFPSPDLSRGDGVPSLMTFVLWIVGAALFGTLVAATAYYRSRQESPALLSFQSSQAVQRELADSLNNADAGPNVEESLRLLGEQHRQGEQ